MLAVELEAFLRQRLLDDLRGFDEAGARLAHRDAEAFVFHAGGAAAEAEQAAAAAHDVQQGDLLGDTDRVMPGQDDHGGAELDALVRPA